MPIIARAPAAASKPRFNGSRNYRARDVVRRLAATIRVIRAHRAFTTPIRTTTVSTEIVPSNETPARRPGSVSDATDEGQRACGCICGAVSICGATCMVVCCGAYMGGFIAISLVQRSLNSTAPSCVYSLLRQVHGPGATGRAITGAAA